MSELDDALKLADRILDKPYIDPDGDICMLARQLLRQTERLSRAQPQQEPIGRIYDDGYFVSRKEWKPPQNWNGEVYASQPAQAVPEQFTLIHKVLAELVELKGFKDGGFKEGHISPRDYELRKAQAWAMARKVLDGLRTPEETEPAIAWPFASDPPPKLEPQNDPRDREIERLKAALVQMEKDHREDMRDAAAQARHAQRFPDEPPGTY